MTLCRIFPINGAIAYDVANGHLAYWHHSESIKVVADHIVPLSYREAVIAHLNSYKEFQPATQQCWGADVRKVVLFADKSGELRYVVNPARFHHLFVYDSYGQYYAGVYADWTNIKTMAACLRKIEKRFC